MIFLLLKVEGSALQFFLLSYRAVTQKPLKFFLEHRTDWFSGNLQEKFGLSKKDKFLPDSYQSMYSMVSHRDKKNPSTFFWVILSACFNIRYVRTRWKETKFISVRFTLRLCFSYCTYMGSARSLVQPSFCTHPLLTSCVGLTGPGSMHSVSE